MDELGKLWQKVEELKRYEQIVETTKNPVGLVDQEYVYQYVNQSYCDALRKQQDEIIGGTVADLFGPEMFDNVLKPQYDRCFEGQDVNYQEWFDFPGWGRRFMDVRYYPFREADGRVSAVVTNVHDITEIKQLEIELKDSQERFQAFMDNIPAAVYIKDENDRHIYGNQSAFESVGMKPEEFIGAATGDLWPPDIADMLKDLDRKIIGGDMPQITEEFANVEEGEKQWRRDIKFPIELESGKRLLGGVAIDITELKLAEKALSEQVEFEQLIADIATQLVHTKPEEIDEVINSSLQALGHFFGTQRAFLGQFTNDMKSLYHRSIWAAEGIEVPSFFFELDMAAASPWFAKQIRSGKVINTGPALVDLPKESGDLRERLTREGINSGVVVPILVEGRSIGMIGLDTVDQPLEFPPSTLDRLMIVADMIGSTLQRTQSQKELQESLAQIKELHRRLEQENIYLHDEIELQHRQAEIIGTSQAVRQMLGQAEQVADTDSTVLILGETGTGKELLARAIHRMSSRNHRPMITVNCAALPATLIESEMFGREKGAFTGALSGRIGRFEVANGSTIFLDEIGELTPEIQIKLLRVLEEGHFERLGSNKTIKVDVRIIAATNRDLAKAVHEGSFRRDLFYRLNVFPITVPSLHDRVEDLEQLVWAFVKEFGDRMGKRIITIPRKSIDALKRYSWQGNIRELRNVIEQSMIITKGSTLHVQLPGSQGQGNNQAVQLKDVERNHITKILKQTGWRVRGEAGAAELLGIKPTTLDARMKKLGIKRPNQRSPL